ncbi:UBN2 domain-containing protein [Tanacetum coccineum]
MQIPPFLEADGFCFWKTRFKTYIKSKDIDLWQVIQNGNSQVKDCKIDLLTQQYEKFSISDEETIDSGFTQFNAIVKSLALKVKVTRGQTSNDSKCQDGGNEDEDKEEEFNSIVKNLWKLFKEGNRFERENHFGNGGDRYDRGRGNRSKGVGSSRRERNCYGCGSTNHFVDDCPKVKMKKVFVGGAWSYSEYGDQMEKDATCLIEK